MHHTHNKMAFINTSKYKKIAAINSKLNKGIHDGK